MSKSLLLGVSILLHRLLSLNLLTSASCQLLSLAQDRVKGDGIALRQLQQAELEEIPTSFLNLREANLSSLLPGGGVSLSVPDNNPIIIDIDAQRISLFQIFQKDIIGTDERVQVIDTLKFPFNSIGQIGSYCTGTVIGPRHILTAAHCVVSYITKNIFQGYPFTLARNGQENPFPAIGWEDVYFPEEFISENSDFYQYDYAVIVLQQKFGNHIKPFKVANTCMDTKNYALNIVGYPLDKSPQGSLWATACIAIWINCRWLTFKHTCDTGLGMSGSAMFESQGNQFVVRGIHSQGYKGDGELVNLGIIMTEEAQKNIMDVVQATL